ncbi:hypothetical protein GQ600_7975 [Phytophthora cactorum]|nr:hypothetical protein GQ600_7975 [Phytophthora cactorum]
MKPETMPLRRSETSSFTTMASAVAFTVDALAPQDDLLQSTSESRAKVRQVATLTNSNVPICQSES